MLVNIKNYTIFNWHQQYKLNEFQKLTKKRFKANAKRSTNHKGIKPTTTTCIEQVSNFQQQQKRSQQRNSNDNNNTNSCVGVGEIGSGVLRCPLPIEFVVSLPTQEGTFFYPVVSVYAPHSEWGNLFYPAVCKHHQYTHACTHWRSW